MLIDTQMGNSPALLGRDSNAKMVNIVRPSPLIRKRPQYSWKAVFLSVEIRACRTSVSPSQPQSAALTAPFRGKRPAPSAPAGVSAASTSVIGVKRA